MVDELFPAARDIMTEHFVTLRPSVGLLDAVERLERNPDHTVFVADEEERFIGVLDAKDCLRALATRAYDDAVAHTVGDVMIPTPPSVAPTTDLYEITQAFLETSVGMLPVVDQGRVVGVVSQLEMLRVFMTVIRSRATAIDSIERTGQDLKERPESIEQMQRVFANLDRAQLTSLLRRNR